MSEFHIECPHCGSNFEVQLYGEPSNMMVFPCARCKTPLMYYHGQVLELDREEFAGLRERLSKVLNVVMKHERSVSEVADSLKRWWTPRTPWRPNARRRSPPFRTTPWLSWRRTSPRWMLIPSSKSFDVAVGFDA